MPSVVKCVTNQHNFPYRTLTHMTDFTTYPYTASHISLKSLLFSSLLTTWCDPQRSVSPWSAWRPEASAPRKSRSRWACRNRQRSGGCRGCARTATWRRATSGDRVVRRLVCVVSFACFDSHLSASCVPLVCGSMAAMRTAFAQQRSSMPGFLLSQSGKTLGTPCRHSLETS